MEGQDIDRTSTRKLLIRVMRDFSDFVAGFDDRISAKVRAEVKASTSKIWTILLMAFSIPFVAFYVDISRQVRLENRFDVFIEKYEGQIDATARSETQLQQLHEDIKGLLQKQHKQERNTQD